MNQVITNDLTPTLDFADVTGALEYWVQISKNPLFTIIEQEASGLATSEFTPGTDLADAKKYHWRFRTRTSAAFTTDQNQSTGDASGIALRDAAARTGLAQGFKMDRSLPLKRITLSLRGVGSPVGNIHVEIWSDTGGIPLAQLGTDSATVAAAGIGTGAFETATFDFTTSIPLVAGTQYHLVVQAAYAVSGVNHVLWEHSGSNNYTRGGPAKQDGSAVWTTNGTEDHKFTAQVQSWSTWSPKWSFWLDSSFPESVTPTAFTYVDPDEIPDRYSFEVQPILDRIPQNIRRAFDRNLAGDLLTEYTATRAFLSMDFEEAYVSADQRAEIERFFDKRKPIFLIILEDDRTSGNIIENIYKAEFSVDPEFRQLSAGRMDFFRGLVEMEEARKT